MSEMCSKKIINLPAESEMLLPWTKGEALQYVQEKQHLLIYWKSMKDKLSQRRFFSV